MEQLKPNYNHVALSYDSVTPCPVQIHGQDKLTAINWRVDVGIFLFQCIFNLSELIIRSCESFQIYEAKAAGFFSCNLCVITYSWFMYVSLKEAKEGGNTPLTK